MFALKRKLLHTCKMCTCSNKVALLQVSGRWLSARTCISLEAFCRKNTLLVPVAWWKDHQKLFSCKIYSHAAHRGLLVKPTFFCQQRKKNVLAQPLSSRHKFSANKSRPPTNESYEGPVLHHSAAAALVLTKQQSEQQVKEEVPYSKLQPSKEDPEVSEQLTEELLFCTTAYVRRVSSSNEWDFPLDSPNDPGPDVEYVVEQRPVPPPKRKVQLSGALPASARDWRSLEWKLSDLPAIYAALAKSRLTGLVVATALGGYVLAPAPMSLATAVGAVAGTGLVSAAANATNQVLEVPYDAQMSRTANRTLVRGVVSPLHAVCFAGTCGVGGLALLLGLCGPAAAGLGLVNLTLYTALYTPLKRRTIANTWAGALVGAIPPLIGWCGCGGPLVGPDAWGAWLMAGLLFAWQFPHFNALSWNLRADYSKAGYRMMCVTDPRLCRVTCVRYSAFLLLLSFAAPALSVTTWTFAVDSAPLNAYMLYLSYRFYKDGDSRSARNLFRFSLLHLPAVMVLLLISKKWHSSAADEAVPPLYTASVVYNKNFKAQTVPTIVAATTEAGTHTPDNDSKGPEISSSNFVSEIDHVGNLDQEIRGSMSLASELEQKSASPKVSKANLNLNEAGNNSVAVQENRTVINDATERNDKTSISSPVGNTSR